MYPDNGREKTGMDVIDWLKKAVPLGVGEILLTSVDQEGTTRGFDLDLVKEVKKNLSIPVIASGGMGNINHLTKLVTDSKVDAIAMAHVRHRKVLTIPEIRKKLIKSNFNIRRYE